MSVLKEVDLGGLEWICFTRWASRWPLDRPSREWTYNEFLQGACRPWPLPWWLRGVNHLAFTLLPDLYVGRPLPIADLWGVLLEIKPQAKYFLGLCSHCNLSTRLSSTGGAKYIPSPEKAQINHVSLNETKSCHVDRKLSSIRYSHMNVFTLSLPGAMSLYVSGRE